MSADWQTALKNGLSSGDIDRINVALDGLNERLRSREADDSSLRSLSSLLDHQDRGIRRKASWSIGKLAQNKTIREAPLDRLIALLEDPDEEVRENAAWALGEIAGVGEGKPEAIAALETALNDPHASVQAMAAWALGRMAEKLGMINGSSIPPLKELLTNKSSIVKKGAEWALERISQVTNR